MDYQTTITNVIECEINPVAVQFENMMEVDHFKIKLYRRGNKKKPLLRVYSDKKVYQGKVKKHDNAHRYVLLLRNRITRESSLISLDLAQMSFYADSTDSENIVISNGMKCNMDVSQTHHHVKPIEKSSELQKEFGSKRAKRATEQHERQKLNVEHIEEQLQQTATNAQLTDTSFNVMSDSTTEPLYRPKMSVNADCIENLYCFEDMLDNELLQQFEAEFSVDVIPDEMIWFDYLKGQFEKLRATANDENTLRKIFLLLLANHLIALTNTQAKSITKKFEICSWSPAINKYILDNFTNSSATGRLRPAALKHKAICYALVFLMIAFDFEIVGASIAGLLNISKRKFSECTRALEFQNVKRKRGTLTLTLPSS